jgi:hypothetical protein
MLFSLAQDVWSYLWCHKQSLREQSKIKGTNAMQIKVAYILKNYFDEM